jgi:hypothetical protein
MLLLECHVLGRDGDVGRRGPVSGRCRWQAGAEVRMSKKQRAHRRGGGRTRMRRDVRSGVWWSGRPRTCVVGNPRDRSPIAWTSMGGECTGRPQADSRASWGLFAGIAGMRAAVLALHAHAQRTAHTHTRQQHQHQHQHQHRHRHRHLCVAAERADQSSADQSSASQSSASQSSASQSGSARQQPAAPPPRACRRRHRRCRVQTTSAAPASRLHASQAKRRCTASGSERALI